MIFAPRLAPAQHLARLEVADLFLDTLPFNAGATASLLHAPGVPELVTHSLQLAQDVARLVTIRAKLAANRPEALLHAMWTDHGAGRKRHIVAGQ